MARIPALHRKEEKLHEIAERAERADSKLHKKIDKEYMKEKGIKKKKPALKKKSKIKKVMHEFKAGELHSGSKKGPLVKSRKQAIAIALSEARAAVKKKKKKK